MIYFNFSLLNYFDLSEKIYLHFRVRWRKIEGSMTLGCIFRGYCWQIHFWRPCCLHTSTKIGKKYPYGIVSVMVGGTKQSTYCYDKTVRKVKLFPIKFTFPRKPPSLPCFYYQSRQPCWKKSILAELWRSTILLVLVRRCFMLWQ